MEKYPTPGDHEHNLEGNFLRFLADFRSPAGVIGKLALLLPVGLIKIGPLWPQPLVVTLLVAAIQLIASAGAFHVWAQNRRHLAIVLRTLLFGVAALWLVTLGTYLFLFGMFVCYDESRSKLVAVGWQYVPIVGATLGEQREAWQEQSNSQLLESAGWDRASVDAGSASFRSSCCSWRSGRLFGCGIASRLPVSFGCKPRILRQRGALATQPVAKSGFSTTIETPTAFPLSAATTGPPSESAKHVFLSYCRDDIAQVEPASF